MTEKIINGTVKKSDAVISLVIGFFIGVFFWMILRAVGIDLFGMNWLIIVLAPPASLLGMAIASIVGKKYVVVLQAAKFALTGALNTFVDLGILNLLIWITSIASGVYFPIFKAISFLAAAINSYFWNKHWTFEKKDDAFSSDEFLRFFLVTFFGFLVNVITATIVVNVVGPQYGISNEIWANVGAVVAALTAFIWNFIGSKFIVFKK